MLARRLQSLAALLLSSLLLLVLPACGAEEPQGSARFTATLAQGATSADITTVRLTVSGPGMAALSATLSRTASGWEGQLGNIPVGTGRTFLAEALDAGGTVRFRGEAAGVTITQGETASVSVLLQQAQAPTPHTNAMPVIDAFALDRTTVAPGGTVTLTVTAHDPNPGDTLRYIWLNKGAGTFSGNGASTVWTAPTTEGLYTLEVWVIDNHDAISSYALEVRVQTPVVGAASAAVSLNHWPVLEAFLTDGSRAAEGKPIWLAATVTDADGDAIGYRWSASCPGTFSDVAHRNPSFTPGAQSAATCDIHLTVTDGRGGQASGTLTVPTGPAPKPTVG
jgi:hypothetical protein